MTPPPRTASAERLLAPLREQPGASAILCDIDGTLAPIAPRPQDAVVPQRAGALLAALASRYALVACVTGRRAAEGRAMVGVDSVTYIGNHGLERLEPGAAASEIDPALQPAARRVHDFAAAHFTEALERAGVTLEDKDAIWSFHFRGAADQDGAQKALAEVAQAARGEGLHPHWGRKVLEIRPTAAVDKGTAVAAALARGDLSYALYGGDDATDLDAFRRLQELAEGGALAGVVRVGVRSDEGPREIETEADVVVEGTDGFYEVLEALAAP
jgi:trehalose 6-phosphate phosphatase